MSSWRLPAPPQSDTATEGAANTFRWHFAPCLSQRLPHCCGTLQGQMCLFGLVPNICSI
jgi:hypothetical protein